MTEPRETRGKSNQEWEAEPGELSGANKAVHSGFRGRLATWATVASGGGWQRGMAGRKMVGIPVRSRCAC